MLTILYDCDMFKCPKFRHNPSYGGIVKHINNLLGFFAVLILGCSPAGWSATSAEQALVTTIHADSTTPSKGKAPFITPHVDTRFHVYDAGSVIRAETITTTTASLWEQPVPKDIPAYCIDAAVHNLEKDTPCEIENRLQRVRFELASSIPIKAFQSEKSFTVRIGEKSGVSFTAQKTSEYISPLGSWMLFLCLILLPTALLIRFGFLRLPWKQCVVVQGSFLILTFLCAMIAVFASAPWIVGAILLSIILIGILSEGRVVGIMALVSTTVSLLAANIGWINGAITEYLALLAILGTAIVAVSHWFATFISGQASTKHSQPHCAVD